jgi:hypothetical protein
MYVAVSTSIYIYILVQHSSSDFSHATERGNVYPTDSGGNTVRLELSYASTLAYRFH